MAFCCQGIAGTFYVDANQGKDTNPGSQTLPWKTITKAADKAVAGDTVLIRQGVYNETIRPANSGAIGNLITFRADQDCACVGEFGQTKVPGSCKVILDGNGQLSVGANLQNRKYIRIEGLDIRNFTGDGIRFSAAASMPPAVSGCEIVNNYIHEIGKVGTDYSNVYDTSVAIAADFTKGALIQNNEIYRIGGYPVFFDECTDIIVRGNTMHYLGHDGICVNNKLGRGNYASNIIIEYNRLYDSCFTSAHQDGMQLWGFFDGAVIRYNTISDFTQLIYFTTPGDDEDLYGPITINNVQIYGNVFFNDKYKKLHDGDTEAIFFAGDVNYAYIKNIDIHSNTFGWLGYDPVIIDSANIAGFKIKNNIFYSGKTLVTTSSNLYDPNVMQSNYNLYKGASAPSFEGPKSIKYRDPQFMDYTGQDSTNFDFHLKPVSPAVDRGDPCLIEPTDIRDHPRDIPDIGAYEYTSDDSAEDFGCYIADYWLGSTAKGDFNRNGIKNFVDFQILADWWQNMSNFSEHAADSTIEDFGYYITENWLQPAGDGDFDNDGIINFNDFAFLADWWKNLGASAVSI